MKTTPSLTLFIFLLFTTIDLARLKIDAEIGSRFEFRHGFGNLFPDDTDPAAIAVQYTGLNIGVWLGETVNKNKYPNVDIWSYAHLVDQPTFVNESKTVSN